MVTEMISVKSNDLYIYLEESDTGWKIKCNIAMQLTYAFCVMNNQLGYREYWNIKIYTVHRAFLLYFKYTGIIIRISSRIFSLT